MRPRWSDDERPRDEVAPQGGADGDAYVDPPVRGTGSGPAPDGRLLLAGEGHVLRALMAAAERAGCRDVRVRRTGEGDAETLGGLAEWAEGETLTAADAVLHVARSTAELAATADRCADAGAWLGQVLVHGDELWTGPFGPADRTAAASAWRRLRGSPPQGRPDGPVVGAADGPAGVVLAAGRAEWIADRLLGAWLGRDGAGAAGAVAGTGGPGSVGDAGVGRAGSVGDAGAGEAGAAGAARVGGAAGGCGHAGEPYLVRTDVRTSSSGRHPVVPLPRPGRSATRAGTETGARVAFLGRIGGAAVEPARLLERIDAVADARTGLLGPVPEATPGPTGLWGCAVAVPDPFAPLPADAPGVTVWGHGRDARSARLAALLDALAAYGTLAAAPDARSGRKVWGLDLVTDRLRRVPAAEAYPASAPGTPYRLPTGAAAGLTWAAAVEAALTGHCEALVIHRLAQPGVRVPRLALPDHGGPAALRALRAEGEPVAHDLSALLSVPACAIRLGDDTVVAVAATRSEALAAAAERALLAREKGFPPTGPGPVVPTVPSVTPDREAAGRPLPVEDGASGRAGLVEVLRARGRTPVAVLLDHDPQAVSLLPYLVHVALLDG
ncbi:hypothetical protein [Streptomyces sp. NBC_00233]|uniref:hypothetical protein n=1 Tax=Streptomyces sp. NBC_00233 TaxID=2975686 RepID=UPI00225513DA|nr:hypothetical protein [Streptomyces sp. NBC_00233]MCX5230191.1 hypothetical protein [Streptomyces sp. NBC_00233]